ncbi:hypothetical protein [Rugosimonospora africana]|uniref:DUF4367 domain-containing protein n=1 Tax=Rugosimonospora africana TaxID=556532 RepID=A0A8J3VST3_9ACTN|nr:hypothetical protein [Rugosimonospora africana]GIH17697.1 hypothetical protein Raf01_58690 [Rugosimonospora africana]
MTELPDELRALGRGMTVRPRDDLADRVLADIAAPATRTARWRRWVAAVAVVLAAVGVSAAVSAPVRAAIVHVFRFGGVEVREAPGPAPASSPALPGEHPTDLADAGREVGFRVRVPGALGTPDAVTVADGRVVSLRYQRPDGPVRVDEFAGNLGVLWEKYASADIARRVSVGGHDGLWFDGQVTLVYVGPDGRQFPGSVRETGATLIWLDGGLTFRLDGLRTLDAALAVAATMS